MLYKRVGCSAAMGNLFERFFGTLFGIPEPTFDEKEIKAAFPGLRQVARLESTSSALFLDPAHWAAKNDEENRRIHLKGQKIRNIFYTTPLDRQIATKLFPDLSLVERARHSNVQYGLYYSAFHDLYLEFGPTEGGNFAYYPRKISSARKWQKKILGLKSTQELIHPESFFISGYALRWTSSSAYRLNTAT